MPVSGCNGQNDGFDGTSYLPRWPDGSTLIPITDDGTPAAFYPFYTKGQTAQGCRWSIGNDIPGFTQNDFGRNAQYGQLAADPHLKFGGGGAAAPRFANFRQFRANPC